MYSKEVTAIILADWGKGESAEETMKHLKDVFGKAPCLNTIYTHRNGLTAKNLVDELLTQQKRAITKTSDEELGLKYRNELLKIFIPQMSINLNKNINENKTEINVTSDLLKQYESLFEEAALLEHCAPQPVHPAQTNK
jgi:hypothetical protein